jgi:hypothetical protein
MSSVDGVAYRARPCQSCTTHRLQALLCVCVYVCTYALGLYLIFSFAEILTCWPACTNIPIRYIQHTVALPLPRVALQTTDQVVPIIWLLTLAFHQTQCRSSLLPSLEISTGPSVFLLASVEF